MNRYLIAVIGLILLATGCGNQGKTLSSGAFEPKELTPETIKKMVESMRGSALELAGVSGRVSRMRMSEKTSLDALAACGEEHDWWNKHSGQQRPAGAPLDLVSSVWPLRKYPDGGISLGGRSVLTSLRLEGPPVVLPDKIRGQKVSEKESSEVSETSDFYAAPVKISYRSPDTKALAACGLLPVGLDVRSPRFVMHFYKSRDTGLWFPHKMYTQDGTETSQEVPTPE